jgi:hypothetical protein
VVWLTRAGLLGVGRAAGGAARATGALPLPKFDTNGRVFNGNTLGTSKAFQRGPAKGKVCPLNLS